MWLACCLFLCWGWVQRPARISRYEHHRVLLIWGGGYFTGFLPPAALLFIGSFADEKLGIESFPAWVQMVPFLSFLAFPLSVSTAVIGWRHWGRRGG